ncbi:MAG: septum formation initiator family protein [Actinomycetaceae bacterium]|nr:septum formation initiator family protein [Actinomycetaceae bacterium]MDU0970695.1 septum formation initiator family protein [Actinomycetaceae bacterium]
MARNPHQRPGSAFDRTPRTSQRSTPSSGRTHGWLGRSVTLGRPSGSTVTVSMVTLLLAVLLIVVVLGKPLFDLANSVHDNRQATAQLAAARDERADLNDQLARWSDPAYISAQARDRLGYVKPGETRYEVVDPPAKYRKGQADSAEKSDRPWFLAIVDSAVAADKSAKDDASVTASRRGQPAEGATPVPTTKDTKQ